MSEEIPDVVIVKAARSGVARLPDGGLLMGMPLSDFGDFWDDCPDPESGADL